MKRLKIILVLFFLMISSLIFFQKIFFPVKYKEEIFESAKKYNIKPEIIFAIIRAESSYREKVVSRKGAVGLMQVMPSTAEWIVNKELGENIEKYDLYNYKDNIEIGTLYYSYLDRKYNGNFEKITAAYNAGTSRINNEKWKEIKETRVYVKRVKIYRKIYKVILYFYHII